MDLLGKTFHHSEHEISIASQADFDNLHNLRREFLFPLVEILLPCSVLLPLPKKGVKLPCPILSRNNMLHPGACQWRSRVECPWQNRPGFFGLVGSGESTASWSGILAQDQKYGETPSNRPYYSRWRTTTV